MAEGSSNFSSTTTGGANYLSINHEVPDLADHAEDSRKGRNKGFSITPFGRMEKLYFRAERRALKFIDKADNAIVQVIPKVAHDALKQIVPIEEIKREVQSESKAMLKTDFCHTDFEEFCKVIEDRILYVNIQLQEEVLSEDLMSQIKEASIFFKQKNVSISVFGRQNCGKSTLLNALIGNEYLPTICLNATSVKVEIQHDEDVHPGLCGGHCKDTDSKKKKSCCPQLIIDHRGDSKDQHYGRESISEALEALNKKIRDQNEANPQPVQPLLKVNIPVIAQKIYPGWQVSLTDNPGFGEHHEGVTAEADRSLQMSAAYIVLIRTEDVGSREIVSTFRNIAKYDRDAFSNRLIIVISKIDQALRDGKLCLEKAKDSVWECVCKAVPEAQKIDRENIISMCCIWALEGSQFDHKYRHYQIHSDSFSDKDTKSLKTCRFKASKALRDALEIFSDFTGGQEEDTGDIVKRMDENKLIEQLKLRSGMCALESRLQRLVSRCIEIWVSKAYNNYDRILTDVLHKLDDMINQSESMISEKISLFKSRSTDFQSVQKMYMEVVKTTKGVSSEVYEEMNKRFPMDIETSIDRNKLREKIKNMIEGFKKKCKEIIKSDEPFGPGELQTELKTFLKESEQELEKEFNKSCEFSSVVSVADKHLEVSSVFIDQMISKATILCFVSNPDQSKQKSVPSGYGGEPESKLTPNLGDLKSQVDSQIPRLTFSLRERFIHALRSAHVRIKNMFADSQQSVPEMEGEEITTYSNIDQLKQLFDQVKQQMENTSNQYLQNIRPHAVMHLYKKHYHVPLRKRISAYDKDFRQPLQQVQENIDEIEKVIKHLKSRTEDLHHFTKHLIEAKVHLKHLYEKKIATM